MTKKESTPHGLESTINEIVKNKREADEINKNAINKKKTKTKTK